MKLKLAQDCDLGSAGETVDVADMGQAHVMMADGLAVRQPVPDKDPAPAKKAPAKKKT